MSWYDTGTAVTGALRDATFVGNYDKHKEYINGDLAYFPSEGKSFIFNGKNWEDPDDMTSLTLPTLEPQEIIRLKDMLKKMYPEDYI